MALKIAPHFFVRHIIGARAGSCKAAKSSVKQRFADRVDIDGRVTGMTYIDSEKKADQFKLEIDNNDLSFFDDPVFRKGNALEVTWGYPGDMSPPRVAIIQKTTGARKLMVEARDCGVLLNRLTRCETYKSKSRSQIAAIVAERNGFGPDDQFIEDTKEVEETTLQARLTDAQFLKRLAYKEGYEWFIDYDGFHFHRRQVTLNAFRTFVWLGAAGNENGIISFNVENDISAKPAAVCKKGRCPSKKCDISEDGSDGDSIAEVYELIDPDTQQSHAKVRGGIVTARMRQRAQEVDDLSTTLAVPAGTTSANELRQRAQFIDNSARTRIRAQALEPVPDGQVSSECTPTPDDTAEKAKRRADGRYRKIQQTAVKMTLTVLGSPSLLAKQMITIEGMGKRLSGNYYITEATHRIQGQAYVTQLKCISDGHGGHKNLYEPEKEKKKDEKKSDGPDIQVIEDITQVPRGGKIFHRYINAKHPGSRIAFDRKSGV